MTSTPAYSINIRALRRWSRERLTLRHGDDLRIRAEFRFEGSTCSNMGRPLAFVYSVTLAPDSAGYRLLEMNCAPAPGDEGHRSMCSWLESPARILNAMDREKPLLGEPLSAILEWRPENILPAGCLCNASSRIHKWLLVLQTIHYSLQQQDPTRPAP